MAYPYEFLEAQGFDAEAGLRVSGELGRETADFVKYYFLRLAMGSSVSQAVLTLEGGLTAQVADTGTDRNLSPRPTSLEVTLDENPTGLHELDYLVTQDNNGVNNYTLRAHAVILRGALCDPQLYKKYASLADFSFNNGSFGISLDSRKGEHSFWASKFASDEMTNIASLAPIRLRDANDQPYK